MIKENELQPVIIQSDGDYVRCRLGELYLRDEVDEYIAKLKKAQRWHKTSEGLPTENDYYLVTNGDFVDLEYGCYNEQDDEWQWEHNGKWEYWMPFPEPPKEVNK